MRYRPEIDGMRALAVLAVVLYHADFSIRGWRLATGGFVGVDVFFVISGYLITAILLRGFADPSFRLRRFYERRARRILPALFLVLVVTIPFGWSRMLPDAFEEYVRSLVAATLFVANFFFLAEDSYTAAASELDPLIHTWSLSVEEQFYLLYPVALLAVWRWGRARLSVLLWSGLLASLLLAEWTVRQAPDTAFYLLPTRGWELLAGAVLARRELSIGRRGEGSRTGAVMAAGGLALVVLSVLGFHDRVRHPGLIGVLPIAGSMAMIWYAGGADPVSRVLRSRALVPIGLISYSLYLWHQPVLAFARLGSIDALGAVAKIACLALSLLLALVSWRFVETPFRRPAAIGVARLSWSLGAAAALLLAFGVVAWSRPPEPLGRLPKPLAELVDAAVDPGPELVQDGVDCAEFDPARPPCVLGGSLPGPNWIVLGDSHLKRLLVPLLEQLERRGGTLVPLTMNGCIYVVGVDRLTDGTTHPCTSELNRRRRAAVLARLAPLARAAPIAREAPIEAPIVVLGGRLQWYLEEVPFDNREGGRESRIDWPRLVPAGGGWDERAPVDTIGLHFRETVDDLLRHGLRVVLVYPIPEVGWDVPAALALRMSESTGAAGRLADLDLSTDYGVFLERTASAYRVLDGVPDHPRLVRVLPERLLCNSTKEGRCVTHGDREVYYRDDDHLSLAGSRLLVSAIVEEANARWQLDRR